MGVIKSKMGTIGRKFEQKRKAKWVKKKSKLSQGLITRRRSGGIRPSWTNMIMTETVSLVACYHSYCNSLPCSH